MGRKRRRWVLVGGGLMAMAATSLVTATGAGAGSGAGTGTSAAEFLVGFAKQSITPAAPFSYLGGEGWLRIGTTEYEPLYVRTLTIQGTDGHGNAVGNPIVLSAVDSQGYFAGYQAGASQLGVADYGYDQIRAAMSAATGVPTADLALSSTHTHTAPDTLGIWGGSPVSYFETVKSACVASLTAALHSAKPAWLRHGQADGSAYVYNPIPTSVAPNDYSDPATWPLDGELRTLQALEWGTDTPIVTLFDFGVHPDILEGSPLISPDWPSQVIGHIGATYGGDAMFVPGTIGEEPVFPGGDVQPHTVAYLESEESAYAHEIDHVVDQAVGATATTVTTGGVGARLVHVELPGANALLLADDYVDTPADVQNQLQLGHLQRALVPPYLTANALGTMVSAMRIGDGVLLNTPGESYSDIWFSATDQIKASWYLLSGLTNDQVGYLTLPAEWPVANAYGVMSPAALYSVGPTAGADVVAGLDLAAGELGFAVHASAADLFSDRDPVAAQMLYCVTSGACQQAVQGNVP